MQKGTFMIGFEYAHRNEKNEVWVSHMSQYVQLKQEKVEWILGHLIQVIIIQRTISVAESVIAIIKGSEKGKFWILVGPRKSPTFTVLHETQAFIPLFHCTPEYPPSKGGWNV